MEQEKYLLAAAKELYEMLGEDHIDFSYIEKQCGICTNLRLLTGDFGLLEEEILHPLFETWEHFSGSPEYPISAQLQDETPRDLYVTHGGKYVGYQLRMRLSLLSHIIDELENTCSE